MGGGTIYSNGFFFQTILADRYIHRRELRLVSLETSSSVEYGIKKIFSIFVFYWELSEFKLLRKLKRIPLFLFTFSVTLTKLSSTLLKFVKVLTNNVIGFKDKDREGSPICFTRVFWLIFLHKFFEFETFLNKKRSK